VKPTLRERRIEMASQRIATITVITEVTFVGDPSPEVVQNYLKHLTEELNRAAEAISLRAVEDHRVLYCAGGVVA
jgi:hypothetical protein